MTYSPPRTLNFHNWLLTTKLQGTFETREESKNFCLHVQLVTPREPGSHDSSLIFYSVNHEQLQPSPWRDISRDERRIRSGVLQEDTTWHCGISQLPLRCHRTHPTLPQLHRVTPSTSPALSCSTFPTQTNHPGSLRRALWGTALLARPPCSQQGALGSAVAPRHEQLYRFPRLLLTPIRIRRNQCSRESHVAVNNQKVVFRTEIFTFQIRFLLVVFL